MAWAKFPTRWIHDGVLKGFVWGQHKGDAIAALLLLIAMAIQRNRQNMRSQRVGEIDGEIVIATYDDLLGLMPMSRAKVASGLALLMEMRVAVRDEQIASVYRLPGIGENGGWAKLPQSQLMAQGHMAAFAGFTLRKQTELDALKLYLLMIAMRSNQTGFAHIGYPKMTEYSGVAANRIKRAKSHLISSELIHVETDEGGRRDEGRPPMRYKILGL
jgi:hypothetical protein